MKLCYVADSRSVAVQQMSKCLANAGNEVHLISFYSAKVEKVINHCLDNRRLVRKKYLYASLPLKLIQIEKMIQQISPDLVHGIILTDHGFCAAFADFHPLVESAWGSDVLVLARKSFLRRFQVKYAVSRADVVAATSKYLAAETARYTPKAKRIVTMPIGVDLSEFSPRVNNSSETIIGVVKNLRKMSGIEYLILALPAVRKKFPEVKVEIFGAGNGERQILDLIKKLHLDSIVQYAGFVPHGQIPERLSRMTLMVMPSLSESFGVAALEAQAMQVPVVATNIGGLPEVVQDSVTGILVNPRSPSEISSAIIRLLEDEKLREEMGRRGRTFVSRKYEWRTTIKKMVHVYRRLLIEFNRI